MSNTPEGSDGASWRNNIYGVPALPATHVKDYKLMAVENEPQLTPASKSRLAGACNHSDQSKNTLLAKNQLSPAIPELGGVLGGGGGVSQHVVNTKFFGALVMATMTAVLGNTAGKLLFGAGAGQSGFVYSQVQYVELGSLLLPGTVLGNQNDPHPVKVKSSEYVRPTPNGGGFCASVTTCT